MRSGYIKALLVLLAATGVELRTVPSAIKLAVGQFALDEILLQAGKRTIRTDIMSVANTLKSVGSHSGKGNAFHLKNCALASFNLCLLNAECIRSSNICHFYTCCFRLECDGSIVIRAPSYMA